MSISRQPNVMGPLIPVVSVLVIHLSKIAQSNLLNVYSRLSTTARQIACILAFMKFTVLASKNGIDEKFNKVQLL